MTHPSPNQAAFDQRGIATAAYGPEESGIRLVESFGALELEYAALRKRCVIIDRPDRGLVTITGADRIPFLNNMVTQELATLQHGSAASTFWLNRKGRIDADIRLLHLEDRTLLELDALTAADTAQSLAAFIFAEDCELTDDSQRLHRIELVGPTSLELIERLTGRTAPPPNAVEQAKALGTDVTIDRDDALGAPTLGLTLPADRAHEIYTALIETGSPPGLDRIGEENAAIDDDGSPAARIRLREAGWHALNIARIEAGLPKFFIDFGPTNLPAETGLLNQRVSFTKGCYLGQEVVARMHALGHPKQTLVALRCEQRVTAGDLGDFLQPETGSPVTPENDPDTAIGAVTSATLSPALGRTPIAFAQVKWGYHEPGTALRVEAEGVRITATVQEPHRFVGSAV